jgi:hypothetical protein
LVQWLRGDRKSQDHGEEMTRSNKVTGPNAGGLRSFPIRTPLAARVGQFCR